MARRPRQQSLPDVLTPADEQLDRLSHDYLVAREERQRATQQEVPAKKALMGAMQEKGLKVYSNEHYVVKIVAKEETVKVKRKQRSKGEKKGSTEPGVAMETQGAAETPAAE